MFAFLPLETNLANLSNILNLVIVIISYLCVSHLYAMFIFKYIRLFNIRKSGQHICDKKRETQDLTFHDVKIFLFAHSIRFFIACILLIPLSVVFCIFLVYATDLIGDVNEIASQISALNPDREFTDIELFSIFLPVGLNAPKYVSYSWLASYLLAAYLTTKHMFENKKILHQFYICK
jgi:hypothetical protein